MVSKWCKGGACTARKLAGRLGRQAGILLRVGVAHRHHLRALRAIEAWVWIKVGDTPQNGMSPFGLPLKQPEKIVSSEKKKKKKKKKKKDPQG